VLDTHVEVGEGARVGGDGDAELCVVGRRARVDAGAELAPGTQVDAAGGADLGSGVRGGARAVSADPNASDAADAAPPVVAARRDPALAARVLASRPLHYAAGADAELDRPEHVRAGSGLAVVPTPAGPRLAVVQDDAHFVALVDPATGLADAVTLPAGVGGRRQFDTGRGNKHHKLDLESCLTVPDPAGGAPVLLAFGSGSTDARERVAVVRGLGSGPAEAADVTLADAVGAVRGAAGAAGLRRDRAERGGRGARARAAGAPGATWCGCSRAATAPAAPAAPRATSPSRPCSRTC
jgi:hypothetical protein